MLRKYVKGEIAMENRNFLLDSEWNIIHYPERPTGFAILIIGDERHFVDEQNSFWMQNEGKLAIIDELKESGYTIFSSNLYGRNWGSERAVELAQRLYQYVIRSEILNNKIHILAEGMGALVAIRLLEKMSGQIRSVALLNPILSLKGHLEQEKENKFFYKKLVKELEAAYHMDQAMLAEELLKFEGKITRELVVPIQTIQVLSGGKSYNQSKLLQKLVSGTTISPTFVLPEKKPQLGKMFMKFYKKHESVL
jgi:hypothetical protein